MRIFATVGNSTEPFDRFIQMLDAALKDLPAPVTGLCQHGVSAMPLHLPGTPHLSRAAFLAELRCADVVVCHAGAGTLTDALDAGHTPLVIPRRADRREIVNDHQRELTDALTAAGRILEITDVASLGRALAIPPKRKQKTSAVTLPETLLLALDAQATRPRERPGTLQVFALRALAALGATATRVSVQP